MTEKTTQLATGHVLPNGAVVIIHDPLYNVVLADWDGEKFVTWHVGENAHTYHGHYFRYEAKTKLSAFHHASADYLRRCGFIHIGAAS